MTSDERAIRDLIAAWAHAAENSDYEKVFSLVAEDGVMLIAGLPPFRSRREYATFVLGAVKPGRKFRATFDIREISVHGDWAQVWSREKSEVIREPGAPPIRAAGDSLNVCRRRPDGQWEVYLAANIMAMEGI